MYQERKKLGFEMLVSNIFSNLGGLILVNLMFAAPLLGSFAAVWAVYKYLLPTMFVVVIPFALVLASPFYAGVVLLSRDYAQNIIPKNKFRTYIKAVKENGLRFLLLGVLLYAAVVGGYLAVKVYLILAAQFGTFFYVLLFFVGLIAVFLLFFFFAVPLMTVSFELKVKDVIKNSALMTFGEFKRNFFILFGTIIFLSLIMFPMIVIPYLTSVLTAFVVKLLLVAYLAISLGLFVPSICSMIISHYLYPNMKAVIAGEGVKVVGDTKSAETTANDPIEEITLSPKEIEELEKGDGDEYIFYQGKMIKRSVLVKMLNKKENNNE